LAIIDANSFSNWIFAPQFTTLTTSKISGSINFKEHQLAKWVTSNHIFESIPITYCKNLILWSCKKQATVAVHGQALKLNSKFWQMLQLTYLGYYPY
jgi:hypothetical protein